MEQVVFQANWRAYFYSSGLALFSVIAVVLVVTGLHSVTAYSVSRRSREFAIRLAVGASRRKILRMVLRKTFTVVGSGILAGGILAWVGMRLAERELFGVGPGDPGAYVLSTAILLCGALLASYLPAHRILAAPPMSVLAKE
jgi:ABC-type antimicrobial peptide transport system permease subunit